MTILFFLTPQRDKQKEISSIKKTDKFFFMHSPYCIFALNIGCNEKICHIPICMPYPAMGGVMHTAADKQKNRFYGDFLDNRIRNNCIRSPI